MTSCNTGNVTIVAWATGSGDLITVWWWMTSVSLTLWGVHECTKLPCLRVCLKSTLHFFCHESGRQASHEGCVECQGHSINRWEVACNNRPNLPAMGFRMISHMTPYSTLISRKPYIEFDSLRWIIYRKLVWSVGLFFCLQATAWREITWKISVVKSNLMTYSIQWLEVCIVLVPRRHTIFNHIIPFVRSTSLGDQWVSIFVWQK